VFGRKDGKSNMGSYKYNKIYRKKHPKKRKIERKRYYDRFSGKDINLNNRQPWTVSELKLLNANITDRELHRLIGRSVKAIQVQRCRAKKEINEKSNEGMGSRNLDS